MQAQQNVILIVDDTPENLRVLGELLESEGIEVRIATNGEHALEIVHSSAVDLVLLDIMMPEMDGYEVCKRLKKDKKTREIPIVFLTALDAFEDEAKGLKLGAVDYITKPFKLELVKSRVLNHLALHNVRLELKYKNEKLEEIVAERTRQLAEAHRRLLTSDSAKYDFLQMIYQDLWAPEKGIISLSQMAFSMIGNETEEIKQLQKQYGESQRQLLETINNALLMAGSQEGDGEPERHPVRLDVVLSDVLRKMNTIAQSKEISFAVNLKHTGIVSADLDLLFQATATVIHAALLMAYPKSTVSIASVEEEDLIVLEIALRGEISPKDELLSLFDHATRFHVSAVGRELGLAVPLATKIVQSIGGNIVVRERAREGYAIELGLKKFSKKKGVRIELP